MLTCPHTIWNLAVCLKYKSCLQLTSKPRQEAHFAKHLGPPGPKAKSSRRRNGRKTFRFYDACTAPDSPKFPAQFTGGLLQIMPPGLRLACFLRSELMQAGGDEERL
ncbi:unnamed protein product [Protopolystoma xenopodis]|uniref:Uncharacterized protein n=1 Tax=Protopolystoma xenopodis TaxID=117903 RepID=A0A3S4ZXJ8_9PLAT|nr:unnamed protein product [Protopolystoma xenopodis]